MKRVLLACLLFSSGLFAQMEVGSVWKVSGNTAIGLEGLAIDSTKIHFLASGIFQISYEQGGNPATETSTWHDLSANSVMVTYDPSGAAFGGMCPDDSTSFVYSVNSNTMTLSNIQGSCTAAASILNNSTWQKVGGTSTAGLSDWQLPHLIAYPNPANTTLTLISSDILSPDAAKVYDILGKEKPVNWKQLNSNQMELDVSVFSSGWYLVQTMTGQYLHFEVR